MAFRRRTRSKLRRRIRERYPVTRSVQEFAPGESVHIRIDASFHKGMVHPRFEGRTGRVAGRRGRAFLVEIMDGSKRKTLIARPEHLSPVGLRGSPPPSVNSSGEPPGQREVPGPSGILSSRRQP